MIEKFFALFQGAAIHKIGLLTGVCSQVVRTFEQEFGQDKIAKNAAIDTMIELLQKYKETSTEVPAEPTA